MWRSSDRGGRANIPEDASSVLFMSYSSPSCRTTATKAENGQIAAGIAGGLIGGALIGGALVGPPVYAAPPPPPVYYEPSYGYGPAPVVVEEPACRLVRQQFWDGYGYQVRRYRVCD